MARKAKKTKQATGAVSDANPSFMPTKSGAMTSARSDLPILHFGERNNVAEFKREFRVFFKKEYGELHVVIDGQLPSYSIDGDAKKRMR